jgi:predicted nucleic acid-binding protein
MIVVEASVAVKWFVPEAGSEEAEAVLVGDEPRAAPEHLAVEVGQALLRHWRGSGVTLEHCRLAMEQVPRFVQLFSTEALAVEALNVAADVGCSVYDGLYLAAAERWDATVVTADARLVAQLSGTRAQARVRLLGSGPARN